VARSLIDTLWHLRLQPIDPGWLDVIVSMPLLNTQRAQEMLGWYPQHTSQQAVAELVEGLRRNEGAARPVVSSRSPLDSLQRDILNRPIFGELRD
jgi:hypothetical protein